MRVCILSVGRSAFSPLLYTKEAAGLVRTGHDVTILAPYLEGEDPDDPRTNYLATRVIPLLRMRWGTRWQKLAALPRLFALAIRQRCDVYQAMEPQTLLIGALAKLLTRRRLVYDSREHYPLAYAVNTGRGTLLTRGLYGLFWLYEAALVTLFVDHVFAVDQGCLERFRCLRRPVSLLTNYPRRDFAPRHVVKRDRRVKTAKPFQFLFTGVTRRRIAVLQTIHAIAKLRDAGIPVEATFLGVVDDAPYLFRCRELIDQLDVANLIHLIGRVPHAEVQQHLQQADCGSLLYLPTPYTEYVTHPVKLFEYMAFGLPVVCSDLPNMGRLVRDKQYGLVVPPTDPQAIAEALAHLIKKPEEAKRLGDNGRRAFLDRCHWEALESDYLQVFEQLGRRATSSRSGSPAKEEQQEVIGALSAPRSTGGSVELQDTDDRRAAKGEANG